MDRQEFKEVMDYMINDEKKRNELSEKEQTDILLQSIRVMNKDSYNFSGYNNLVIVIEELAELQKELTKALRNNESIIGILEELADVSIGLDYIKEIFDITDRELHLARCIKLKRLDHKIKTNSDKLY